MKRHPEILIRLPEGTSINCATAFNKIVVGKFINNLESFLAIDSSRKYNADETGILTVARFSKNLAKRVEARVAVGTSGERESNITVIGCMSAIGSFVAPMFIFKRLRMAEHLMKDALVGSIGDCSDSGWAIDDLFGEWLIHYKNFTKCSSENPLLLIADNHNRYISLKIFYFLCENGIKICHNSTTHLTSSPTIRCFVFQAAQNKLCRKRSSLVHAKSRTISDAKQTCRSRALFGKAVLAPPFWRIRFGASLFKTSRKV